MNPGARSSWLVAETYSERLDVVRSAHSFMFPMKPAQVDRPT